MARGVNKVILVGNLGKDPETRYMPNGKAVTNFSIATSESWKDKQTGEQREQTEWHNIVMYDRLAEIAAEYLRKGSQVYVEGRLRTRKWQDKEGRDRYTTEINANEMQMLGSRAGGAGLRRGQGESRSAERTARRRRAAAVVRHRPAAATKRRSTTISRSDAAGAGRRRGAPASVSRQSGFHPGLRLGAVRRRNGLLHVFEIRAGCYPGRQPIPLP